MTLKQFAAILFALAAVATIVGLFIAILQLLQSSQAQLENSRLQSTSIAYQVTREGSQLAANASLATQVALSDQQLGVQKTIASVRVEPQSGSTATAVADVISRLSATSQAIESQRQVIETTQTALARPLPTPQPAPPIIPQPTVPPAFPGIFLSENQIPQQGSTFSVKVDSGTIHVMTSGPICFGNICLPGGEERGSVVVLLPRGTPYLLTGLIQKENWHGAYYGTPDQWRLIADDRSASMKKPGNCTGGKGCVVVDVLAISGDTIVAQYSQ